MTTGHAIYPSLHGKNVVVTGGAEGIGAAAVELFALQGSRVFFLDIATDSAQKVIDRVASLSSKEGGPAVVPPVFFHCDVTDLDKLQATASQILEEHGTVHVLVNNAARVIVFLGSDEASGVTGSSYYTVDGGWCSDP
ncbi:hypothetical protein SLS64_011135 [Diaporthe eres]